jgi:transposase-like protein
MNSRVEIITGPERRRRWSNEEKLQLVAEACQPGNSVSQVARERGISASLGRRRKAMAKGLITDPHSGEYHQGVDVCTRRDRERAVTTGRWRQGAVSTSAASNKHFRRG